MDIQEEFEARHPYEDRMTVYVYSGTQYFDGESFPLYTADKGEGTTVCLETILERNKKKA